VELGEEERPRRECRRRRMAHLAPERGAELTGRAFPRKAAAITAGGPRSTSSWA
jgi:hypothetical protein